VYPSTKKKLLRRLALVLLVGVAVMAVYVALQPYERWRAHAASLEPYVVARSTAEVLPALRSAANRIGGWHYVGEAGDDDRLQVVFTREVRIPGGFDDVTVTLRDEGTSTRVSARSTSRRTWADFGRNRRNLSRLRSELAAVLDSGGNE